jgi:hypothetical protein
MHRTTRESGNIILIIVGIVLVLFLIGFFRSQKSFFGTVNYKAVLNLPCGLTVQKPDEKSEAPLHFPITVAGYVNGCGWERNGMTAGTAQVFDGQGIPVTALAPLAIPEDSTEAPFYFEGHLSLTSAPRTSNGSLIIHSTTGLMKAIPVTF